MGGRRGRAAVAALLAVALTGCSHPAPVQAPSPSASATARDTRDRALERFRTVAQSVVDAHRKPTGTRFARALERAGYAPDHVQFTADRTTVGLAVPAVQFAARSGRSCLIGQYGDGHLRVLRTDPVDGTCLVGDPHRLG